MTNEVVSVWNEERLGQLTKLWAQGLSLTQIVLKLGVTRNAVVGKLHLQYSLLHAFARPNHQFVSDQPNET